MKLTTQLAVVIITAIIGIGGLIVGLAVLADWSDGAIIGMVTAFGAVIVNSVIAVRNQAKTAEVLTAQTEQLDTITEQTNGKSDAEVQRIVERALAAHEAKRGLS